jgi:phosphatidylinositol glycan class K
VNVLSVYHLVKKLGIPDSQVYSEWRNQNLTFKQIILMVAEDHACSSRNIFRGQLYKSGGLRTNLYENVEIDYRAGDVTVDNFLRLLTGPSFHFCSCSNSTLRSANSAKAFLSKTRFGWRE